ncbi:ssDNA endonuclease and repair protein rad10 [Emydomyces testavorans]|uniref:SsDNA endonuclease and repair protein rad10 n=1 Tax=Emydomyces testavorans TaxID=2070801 RepID=A0AAF0DCJ4_9EURO|nr:ssDNA endonuclease and repair protein rad10 [Emydomyces testavorans]
MDEFGEVPDFGSIIDSSATPETAPAAPASLPKPSVPPKVQQPKPQIVPNRGSRSAILVSTRQKGNPILNHVRLLSWEYADIPADYILGSTTCALFLSLKYHRLHPEYVYSRIKLLGGKFTLRILLIMVDIPNHEDSLKELSKTSIVNNLTLILCWSAAEAGHYLELFKSSENAPPTAIRSQQARSYKESLVEFITTPRSINKSDAASLISTFGSLQAAINAQPEQISSIPGWGERKVSQWTDAVKEEFKIRAAARSTATSAGNVGAKNPRTQARSNTDPEYMDQLFNEADEQERRIAAIAASGEGVSEIPGVRRSGEEGARATLEAENKPEEINEGIIAELAKLRKGNGCSPKKCQETPDTEL